MDKGETIKIAKQAGIPTPKTWFPENESTEDIRNQVNYPILIRPRRSSGSRGIKFVNCQSEFDEKYNEVLKQYGTPIVQEYIEKSGYTTACLLFSRDNQVVGEFSYERVKEYPLSGGPTVVGISTNDEEAKYYAKTLLGQLDWAGPAEVEFILDQNGTPKLLEVNPRFWMPLQLAISAGVDFPNLIAKLVSDNDLNPVSKYELGIKYRWVLPNEILWALNSQSFFQSFHDLLQFNSESECYGSLSKRDPEPALGTLAQSLRFVIDPEKRQMIFQRGWNS
ncbi:ATP-grasp domain-containing protein [Natrialbaceae archaeon A-chndr2]